MDPDRARAYLTSLLNQRLHVYTNDDRFFIGTMKCTDKHRNIILSTTEEYRLPSRSALDAHTRAFTAHVAGEAGANGTTKSKRRKGGAAQRAVAPPPVPEPTARYVGLVVVPGRYVTRIRVEGPGVGLGDVM
ncbi:hypothetical protein LTR50_002760 [Elasticomyces elasticus]|nr:hypothetical protein LTR50_002760 [Elasticomyces elasticus]